MSARLTLLLVIAGLLAVPTAASAATKNGITPLSPKAGATVPAGKRPTFKMRVNGPGPGLGPRLQVQEEGRRRRHLHTSESIGRAKKKGGIFQYKPKFFDFPGSGSTRPAPTTGRRTASPASGDLATAARRARSSGSRSGERVTAAGPHRLLGLAVPRAGARRFYPPRLPPRRWLEHYATRFDTVEVNAPSTGSRSPRRSTRWVPTRRRTSSSRSRRAAT